jgi:hypothetical protein
MKNEKCLQGRLPHFTFFIFHSKQPTSTVINLDVHIFTFFLRHFTFPFNIIIFSSLVFKL